MLSLNLPEGGLSELLYADDLVLMSETIEGPRDKFLKWKEALLYVYIYLTLSK